MNLFDRLVDEALVNQGELAPLRPVVEKELLHFDILREISAAGLLASLTFIGGTCLRACYGSNRLSEDLDFTGGTDFRRETLAELGKILVTKLHTRYDLQVEVTEPVRETGNVSTWKLKVLTRPGNGHLPAQKIHIDICSIPSYERRPMVLRNQYGVDMGTSGLIIQAESREEILADKLVAFALRPNRLKNRDLWDIGWLKQQNIRLPVALVANKITDHKQTIESFCSLLAERNRQLNEDAASRKGFVHEMQRFLPRRIADQTVAKEAFWSYLTDLVAMESEAVIRSLYNTSPDGLAFSM